jgi:GT2 family glycosyltransferase
MDLSIIIVNKNASQLLRQCLESIYLSGSGLTFEIIVVDNGSTDDSISSCAAHFPEVRIISNDRNLGFAKANNQGLAVAKGRYFLLLNSDTIVLPAALDELVRVADDHAEIGAIGPTLLNLDGTLQKSWSKFPTLWSEILGTLIRRRQSIVDEPFAFDVDWIGGACILVRSETVADVGTLDEDYFFYSEEVDWCFRMKKKGWKVWYLSSAKIYHIGGGSSKQSLWQMGLLYQNKLRYFNKNHGLTQATVLRYGLALANFFGLIRHLPFLTGKKPGESLDTIKLRAKLIQCLLQNKYPDIQV